MDGGGTDGRRPLSASGPVSRRGLLGVGLAGAAALLTGCGLRLDLPQPPPPTPTRQPVPDEALLLSFVRDIRELELMGRGLPKAERDRAVVRDAIRVLADQDDVLTGRLTNAGVPTAVIDATPPPATTVPTSGPAPGPTSTGAALPAHSTKAASSAQHLPGPGAALPAHSTKAESSAQDLPGPGAALPAHSTNAASSAQHLPGSGAALPAHSTRAGSAAFAAAVGRLPEDRWQSLADATVANRATLVSATSARLAAAIRLGRPVPFPAGGAQALHTTLVEHTAPLVYGFEVVAAQSAGDGRTAALRTLDQLRRLLEEVGPEVSGSALPGGWSLPYPVTTPPEAARLAKDLLAHAIDATTTLLPPTPSTAGVAEATTWSARVQALGPAHGIPLSAFPGTSGAARS